MPNSASALHFPPFHLDLRQQRLWRGNKEITLRRQTFAVLRYLVEHAGEVVSKETLLDALWPGVYVTDAAPMLCIRELRTALGDDAQQPRFIQTVHRRGYRFIAEVVSRQSPVVSKKKKTITKQKQTTEHWPLATRLVGREAELGQLQQWLEKARNGTRQMVFVTGEPGIGKTTLVDAFLATIESVQSPKSKVQSFKLATGNRPLATVLVGRGQCIEQYGTGEPYLPVLEALGRLGQGMAGKQLKPILHHYAPTWLVQMPAMLSAKELQTLRPRVLGATREHMLRELAHALEILTTAHPLVLVVEDLHWADASTLDLLAVLVRRRESARLLVLTTYRPLEVLGTEHLLTSLISELGAHELCGELALRLWTEAEVAAYLDARFPASMLPTRLAAVLHQRTGGNPLFVVSTVNDWVQRSVLVYTEGSWALHGDLDIVATQIPNSIRQLVSRQRQRLLLPEQRILEAGSVAGLEFSVASVAVALETEGAEVEERCLSLAERQQFLRPAGIEEWPDGTVAARYGFLHALYQQLWHERVSVQRQQQWHRRIGERKEAAYGERAREIATELAVHFEQGRDYPRAIRYLQRAGETAVQRSANTEAISLLSRGLALLQHLPETPECTEHELTLRLTLGPALMASKGYAAPEVEQIYTRAQELCQRIGEMPHLFLALCGLWAFHLLRAKFRAAYLLGEQLLRLAQKVQDPALMLEAHRCVALPLFYTGELVASQSHLQQVMTLYDLQQHRSHAFLYGQDPRALCGAYAAWGLWIRGYPDQASQTIKEALALTQELDHVPSAAQALCFMVVLHSWCREWQTARARAEELIALSTAHELPIWLATATFARGWALAEQRQPEEGLAQMHRGITDFQATGGELGQSLNLSILADVYGKAGRAEDGLTALSEALKVVHKTGERWYEAELHRLKGQLTLQCKMQNVKWKIANSQAEAEKCFHKAIEVARRQEAKSLELRATVSLSRLWQQQGKQQQAHKMLAEIYGWFTEGFDTIDLQEAKALLQELTPS